MRPAIGYFPRYGYLRAMHYILFYDVVEDYVARRATYRQAHLERARRALERGDLILAGALADPVDGAVLVFRGPSSEPAVAFAKADPYVIHGLVTRWRVRKWDTVVARGPAWRRERLGEEQCNRRRSEAFTSRRREG